MISVRVQALQGGCQSRGATWHGALGEHGMRTTSCSTWKQNLSGVRSISTNSGEVDMGSRSQGRLKRVSLYWDILVWAVRS